VKTISSIDSAAEIIVSLTPNPLLEDYFRLLGIPFVCTPLGNHGATANAGIKRARHSKILIMDSDCVFTPGTIRAVEDALDEHLVVNVPIVFADRGTIISRAIALCRRFDNTYDKPAYKPGIAFRRELSGQIGGYWYDERINWPCDSEFLWRLRKSGISVHHLDRHAIIHRPNSLSHVCRAYFNYGRDGWKRVSLLGQSTHLVPPRNLIRKHRILLRSARREPGLLFNLLLELLYIAGFSYQALKTGQAPGTAQAEPGRA